MIYPRLSDGTIDWCACGIRSIREDEKHLPVEIRIGYVSIAKTSPDVCCSIKEAEDAFN